ncbi:MAG: CRTAC1 family protein [bacterium]|nr:CRTAC1 family protein [bacterium]
MATPRRAADRYLAVLIGCLALAASTVASPNAATEPGFEDVAAALGIEFVHVRASEQRLWFPEIMSGGAAWLDYDGDGDLDLYLVQGGQLEKASAAAPANRLYRNDGGRFVDVTGRAGVGDTGYGMGAAVGDANGDGDADLYVTNVGANVLYLNNRDGTFSRAVAGVEDAGWGTSAAFVDIDLDGDLDLFVVSYVAWSPANEVECYSGGLRDYCHPNRYNAPQQDRLFLNLGSNPDGTVTFEDASVQAGISRAFGNGLGVAPLDFDQDGLPDLYVANDGMPNQLWINQGDGQFVDRAVELGCAVNMAGTAEAGMGVAVADVDGDGRGDLLLTHLRQETNTLYLNRQGFCEDATARLGLAAASINRTGFGTGLADFDHDGHLDLFVTNGRVGAAEVPLVAGDPYAEPDQLFRGEAGGRFRELPPTAVGSPIATGRAAAFADFDFDGDVDVAVVNNGGGAHLLRNRTPPNMAWARFRLLNRAGANALGGRVAVEAAGRSQWRRVESAYSYCSANEAAADFGLGKATALDSVRVRWPGGREARFADLPTGKTFIVYR